MNTTTLTKSTLSCYYTEKEIERYTKKLADLGITEEEIIAVLDFIHKLARIAVDIVVEKNNSTTDRPL